MSRIDYKTILWDFDGVWSKDFFYKSLAVSHPTVWRFIQTNIFGPANESRTDKWMRGELSMNDINKYISRSTGMALHQLNNIFLKDAADMVVEKRHIPIIKMLKRKGKKVGMVTDNMDVFNIVTIPRFDLNKLFNGQIFNSFSYKKRKSQDLFEIAIKSMKANYSSTLMIDDSPKAKQVFEINGGHVYLYNNFEDFESWAYDNLL